MSTVSAIEPILFKVVFEVRYRFGYLYLDRCGRILNSILQDGAEWVIRAVPQPQAASVTSMRNSATFVYSSDSFSLSVEKATGADGIADEEMVIFSEQADVLGSIVQSNLNVTDFKRIGLRVWYLFPCQNKPEAERWLMQLGLFEIPARVYEAFSGNLDSASASILISTTDRKIRLAATSVERSAVLDLGDTSMVVPPHTLSEKQDIVLRQQLREKRRKQQDPGHAVMIDIDSFIDDPGSEINISDFIRSSRTGLIERLREAAATGPHRKRGE